MSDLPPVDVHFGSDEEMLAWATKENLPILRDHDGHYDWEAVYAEWKQRVDAEDPQA